MNLNLKQEARSLPNHLKVKTEVFQVVLRLSVHQAPEMLLRRAINVIELLKCEGLHTCIYHHA